MPTDHSTLAHEHNESIASRMCCGPVFSCHADADVNRVMPARRMIDVESAEIVCVMYVRDDSVVHAAMCRGMKTVCRRKVSCMYLRFIRSLHILKVS